MLGDRIITKVICTYFCYEINISIGKACCQRDVYKRQALGVDAGCHATLVHFPAWPAVWLARNDDTGFQQVLERCLLYTSCIFLYLRCALALLKLFLKFFISSGEVRGQVTHMSNER